MKPLLLSLLLLPAVAFANPTKWLMITAILLKISQLKLMTQKSQQKIAKDAMASLNAKKFDFAKLEATEAQFKKALLKLLILYVKLNLKLAHAQNSKTV